MTLKTLPNTGSHNDILNLLLQPKLLSYELLDLVSSHFNLKEKEFFGLAYFDDKYVVVLFTMLKTVQMWIASGLLFLPVVLSGQRKWLQMDRRVLEHDFSKKSVPFVLNFLVR